MGGEMIVNQHTDAPGLNLVFGGREAAPTVVVKAPNKRALYSNIAAVHVERANRSFRSR